MTGTFRKFRDKVGAGDVLLYLLMLGGLLITIKRALTDNESRDFAYLWTAGKMWSAGLDPYGDGYQAVGRTLFSDPTYPPEFYWVYPPQWALILMPLGKLSFWDAAHLWGAFNVVALIGALLLIWRTLDRLAQPPPLWIRAVIMTYIFTAEFNRATFSLGQTGIVVLLGIVLLSSGFIERKNWMTTAGLTLLALKPPIGLMYFLVGLSIRQLRTQVILAAVTTGVLVLLAYVATGTNDVPGSIGRMLHNFSAYSTAFYNLPTSMTGLRFPIYLLSGADISSFIFLAIAVALSIFVIKRYFAADEDPGTLLAPMLIVSAIASLHYHDMVFLPLAILFTTGWNRRSQMLMVVFLVMFYRPRDMALLLFQPNYRDLVFWQVLIIVIATFSLLAAGIIDWHRRRHGRDVEVDSLPTIEALSA